MATQPRKKTPLPVRIDPALMKGLDALQAKLEHSPSRTTLVEDAIELLLAKHKIPIGKLNGR